MRTALTLRGNQDPESDWKGYYIYSNTWGYDLHWLTKLFHYDKSRPMIYQVKIIDNKLLEKLRIY